MIIFAPLTLSIVFSYTHIFLYVPVGVIYERSMSADRYMRFLDYNFFIAQVPPYDARFGKKVNCLGLQVAHCKNRHINSYRLCLNESACAQGPGKPQIEKRDIVRSAFRPFMVNLMHKEF